MKGDKLAFQIKFWALIGPLICLLALFVFVIKSSTGFITLPMILLVGVPLCWRWKLLGVAIAVALMACFLGYYYSEIALEDRFWYLGMGLSIAIALFITALSFDEVEALVAGVQLESRSRLENLWKVDEKQRQTEENLKKRRDQIRELQVKVRSYKKLIDMTTGELVDLRANYSKVVKEFEQHRQEKTVASGPAPDLQAFAAMRRALQLAEAEAAQSRKELEEQQHSHSEEVETVLRRHLERYEKERAEDEQQHQQDLDALQEVVNAILIQQQK